MTFNIKSLSEPEVSRSTVMLGYGGAGSGKTHLAGTIGKNGLVINVGAGQDTWLSPAFLKSVPSDQRPSRIDVVEELDLDKPTEDNAGKAFDLICDITTHVIDSGKYDTLAIDDGTFFSRTLKSKALSYNKITNKSTSLVRSLDLGVPVFEIQDYGTELDILHWYLSHFLPKLKEKNINFLLTAHEGFVYRKPPGSKITDEPVLHKVYPLFTGKKDPAAVVKYFDLVWHFTTFSNAQGQVFRQARTIGNDTYECKTRWEGLFNAVEKSPTFEQIRSKITNHINSLRTK